MMQQQSSLFWLTISSIVVAIVVMALKYYAYLMTDSIALLSDATESIVNIITAFIACGAVAIAAKPADANHPFGHSKAEYFSSVLEGVLIVVAALFIVSGAYFTLLNPRKVEIPLSGLAVNGIAALINVGWAWLLMSFGRRYRSQAIIANASHLFADVLTSVSVIAGLGLVYVTGWYVLDPLLAVCVAVHILFQGWRVTRESVDGLMDKAVSDEMIDTIRKVISETASGALEVHDLKTRTAGSVIFVEFHMVVPGSMTVSESHAICDKVESKLQNEMQNIRVLIHTEPEDMAKHRGILVI